MADNKVPSAQTGNVDNEVKTNPSPDQLQGAQQFAAHQAHPGPAVPQSMPEQEGTKEERQAKAKELNK